MITKLYEISSGLFATEDHILREAANFNRSFAKQPNQTIEEACVILEENGFDRPQAILETPQSLLTPEDSARLSQELANIAAQALGRFHDMCGEIERIIWDASQRRPCQ